MQNRHPWIYSGAVKEMPNIENGEMVEVVMEDEKQIGTFDQGLLGRKVKKVLP